MTKPSSKIFVGLATLLMAVLWPFQNCANVSLTRPPDVSAVSFSGPTNWCLGGSLEGYTLSTFYVRNINIVPWQGQFLVDSDGDGLPDAVEIATGFDPANPRSRSSVLDSICFNLSGSNSCSSAATNCDATPGPLGLSSCDVSTLRLDQVYQHPTMGLDTDKDGIPDYFEILGGTNPTVADANADPDHDTILNHTEYERQSNPLYADAGSALVQIQSQKITGAAAASCAGEVWQLQIDQVPLAPDTLAVASTRTGVFQPHAAAQNVVVAVVKLVPNGGISGNARLFYQTFIIDKTSTSLSLNGSSMSQAGEVLP